MVDSPSPFGAPCTSTRPSVIAALTLALAASVVPVQAATESRVVPHAFVSATAVRPGGTFRVAVHLSIDAAWHVQANPPSEESFIATTLTLDPAAGLAPGTVRYPEGTRLDAPALGGTLLVFNDGVVFGAEVRVAPDAAPGERVLRGKVTFQACDDHTCLFPKSVELTFPIRVDPAAVASAGDENPEIFRALATLLPAAETEAPPGGGHPPPPTHAQAPKPTVAAGAAEPAVPATGVAASASPAEASESAGADVAAAIASRGFLLWLLGVFALGLGLNLTPCVYPVLAVTLTYFGRQEGTAGSRAVRAVAYASGIMATFTALFLIAGLSGELFGAWLQNAWVLAALAVVLIALALANFGLYEIQAPAFLRNRVAGGKTGVVGALLMGLAMGIVAAPCVGPLIGGLLLWAGQQRDLGAALAAGLALSGGLGLPYVFLGIFSGSLSSLPRSGDWLKWVEHAMGCVLLGVALYFLAAILPPTWFLPAFALLIAASGIWLGLLDANGRASRPLWFIRGVVFTAALGVAVGLVRLERTDGIEWRDYSSAAVAAAAAAHQPALVEFTAAWCVPCRVMEYGAFKDARVIAESRRFVRLRIDLTGAQDPASLEGVKRYEVAGPPVLVFLGPDGTELRDLRVVEAIGGDELLSRMQRVPR